MFGTIYIRHAEKRYKNNGSMTYPLDPDLTEQGIQEAKNKFLQLLITYGVPNSIICSPYLRARQTAILAANVIYKHIGILVPIIYDRDIGEYLGHQDNINNQSFTKETWELNPIVDKSWYEFEGRIKLHKVYSRSWCITHGVVIQSLAKTYNKKIKHPKTLTGILIEQNNIILI